MLNCIDNSGAAVVECVNVLRKKRPATVGRIPEKGPVTPISLLTASFSR